MILFVVMHYASQTIVNNGFVKHKRNEKQSQRNGEIF